MLGLLGSIKVNILLVDADGVSLLQWTGRKLQELDHFVAGKTSSDRFHFYLEHLPKIPFVIVTDFIEEDFRTELSVHVRGNDRTVLLQRRLAHLFRNTIYRTAKVIGRETTGRKDDRLLLTALTKPEIIDPWVNQILANRVSILAVTSAAYVMEHFAQSMSLKAQPHLLIVNQESSSGLRQTYLQKGRVIFSRLTPAGVSRSDSFEALLVEQCDQTRKYLERIKQLPYDTMLEIHVFTAERFSEEPESVRDQLHYYYHWIDELKPRVRMELNSETALPGALHYSLARSMKKGGIPNVYAPLKVRRFAILRSTARYLYLTSVLLVVCMTIYISPSLLRINDELARETQMRELSQPLLVEYERLRETFPETPIPSGQMELVVSSYESIVEQVSNPRRTLNAISEALLESPELQLGSIAWQLEAKEAASTEQNIYGVVESDAQRFQNALVSRNTVLVTRVQGVVEGASSYRNAREQILTFSRALEELVGVPVEAVNMPMDVSATALVTTVIDGRDTSGEFTLEFREDTLQ